MAVKVATCVVCSASVDVKYKCPTCREPYCSVKCCKEHKLGNCKAEILGETNSYVTASTPNATRTSYNYETEDTVAVEQLNCLRDSRKLKEMLENPHLRQMLEAINGAGDAAHLISKAMHEPIFLELADECLRIIDGSHEAESDGDL